MKNGRLRRKDNTIYLETEEGNRPIPIEDINAIYLYGEVDLNTKLLNFLAQKNVVIHVFNYYGFYAGSYYPREYLNSGYILVRQVEHYLDPEKRLTLAKEIVSAASANILRNLKYYRNRKEGLEPFIEAIENQVAAIEKSRDVEFLRGIEGRIHERYYDSFNVILEGDFDFHARVRRPPDNMINALLSFGNSMTYTAVLTEIYRTQLNPTVSYLHEPGARRFSLSLDLAEIFKPIITDRVIFKLINTRALQPRHFDQEVNYCYLNENGRKIFIQEYEERLKTTINHRNLNRKVSYQRLIRLECYKLIKHLAGLEPYRGFCAWW